MKNAYQQGYSAAFHYTSNPYDSMTEAWMDWERGYIDSMNDNFVDKLKADYGEEL